MAECSAIPSPPIVAATDNCDLTLTVNYIQQSVPGNSCYYVLVRTWSVSDDCGNSSSATQTLTVTDTTPPTLNNVPSNTIVQCDDIPAPAFVTGSDNCDDYVEVTFSQIISQGCPYTITRTWVGVDNCGNDVSATQVLTVIDSTYPVIHGVPASITLQCNTPVSPAVVTATDNCSQNLVVSLSANTVYNTCGSILTRTWSVTDNCGNTTTASQVITFIDTTPPYVIQSVPAELTFQCDETEPAYSPTFGDNCDNDLLLTAISGINNVSDCGFDIERSWTATDDCGNSTTVSQILHFIDTTNPVLVGVPANTSAQCNAVPAPPLVTATDNCSVPSVSYSQSMTEGCPYTITRTWTATDACGNESTATQTIIVTDTSAPYLVNNPPIEFNIECGQDVPEFAPIFGDNCDQNLIVLFTENLTSGSCPGGLIRTWVVTDHCGNSFTFEQFVFTHDTTPPTVLVDVQHELTVECDDELPSAEPLFFDSCDSEFVVTTTYNTINITECGEDVIRTWTATDYCENSTTITQIIHVIDSTDPVISWWPEDNTYQCGDEIPAPGQIVVTDNCDENVEVMFYEESLELECGYVLERTWTAYDQCNNQTSVTQYIYVIDELAPVLYQVPADTTIECGQPIPGQVAFYALDNCDATPTLNITEVIIAGSCGYQIKRYYIATDDCGNTMSIPQIITVVDTTAPIIVAPADVTVPCNMIPNAPELNATDICDSDVNVVFSELMETGCPYNIVRTWTATDDCGNQTIVSQIISVYDEVPPVFLPYAPFVMVNCDEFDTYTIVATDNCDANVEVNIIEEFPVSGGCYGNVLRTYEAVDRCGNFVTGFQIIEIIDNTPPVLHNIPTNTTIECGSTIPSVPGNIYATDNCDTDMQVMFTQTQTNEFCPYDIIRTWTVTDRCGNTTSQTQTVHVSVIVPGTIQMIAYPNPALQHFTLKFSVPTDQEVFGAIVDARGRLVLPIHQGKVDGGRLYMWDLDARNLEAGSYIITMKVGDEMHHQKLVIIGN